MQADESHSFSAYRWSFHPLSLSPPPFLCALLRWRTWTTEGLRLAALQFSHLLHCWAFSLSCFHNCWAVSPGFCSTHIYTHFQQVLFISSELLWYVFNTWHFWLRLRPWNTKTHIARVALCWKSIEVKSLQCTKAFGIDWGLFLGGGVLGHHMAAIIHQVTYEKSHRTAIFHTKADQKAIGLQTYSYHRTGKRGCKWEKKRHQERKTNKALAINCA